jgi:hypothetical protein
MDEETFNLTIRRFLKTFGVTAQREIEKAVREAVADGRLHGDERLGVRATLMLDRVGSEVVVEGEIALQGAG